MPNEAKDNDWIKEIEISGHELVKKIKELIQKGNVRKIRIKNSKNEVLMEIPLNAGVAGVGAIAIFAPVLAAVGALAVFLTSAKIEVVRNHDQDEEKEKPEEKEE